MELSAKTELGARHFCRDTKGLVRLWFAPRAKIHRVERNAEHICGDEAELRRAESDHAHDGAIDSRQNPALPATLAQQDGRYNCKNAGYVIKPEQHRSLRDNVSM